LLGLVQYSYQMKRPMPEESTATNAAGTPAELLPDIALRQRANRERLARLVVNRFDRWRLAAPDQASLLGLSPDSRATVARYRKGEPLADSADLLARAGHLLGIHKALRIIFPHDPDLAYRWVTMPNRRFGDR